MSYHAKKSILSGLFILGVKGKSTVGENNIGEYLHTFGISKDFISRTPKALSSEGYGGGVNKLE